RLPRLGDHDLQDEGVELAVEGQSFLDGNPTGAHHSHVEEMIAKGSLSYWSRQRAIATMRDAPCTEQFYLRFGGQDHGDVQGVGHDLHTARLAAQGVSHLGRRATCA